MFDDYLQIASVKIHCTFMSRIYTAKLHLMFWLSFLFLSKQAYCPHTIYSLKKKKKSMGKRGFYILNFGYSHSLVTADPSTLHN